jgi:hypothetical protein
METEGTYILSGIVQGPVPPGPDGAEQLQGFCDKLAKSGISMSLRVDGARFSLLAADRAVETDAVTSSDVEGILESALNSLLELFPEGMRLSVMSTIRSRVFLGDREHQAVYVVSFPGVIKVETAAVKAKLRPRVQKLTLKQKSFFALGSLVLLALAIWASTRWVDYGSLGQQFALMFKPNKLEDIRLNASSLRDVVIVEKSDMSSLRRVIILKVSRGPGWDGEAAQKGQGVSQLHEALFVRRYLKVTYFDVTGNIVIGRDGRVLERVLPVADLKDAVLLKVEIPLPEGLPLSELVISP